MPIPFTHEILEAQTTLAAAEAEHGMDHPALLPFLSKLEDLYQEQWLYGLQRDTSERIDTIESKSLEPDDPRRVSGKFRAWESRVPNKRCKIVEPEGEPLEEQLKDAWKTHGVNSPPVIPILHKMVRVLERGWPDVQSEKIIELDERILAIQTATLGADHPDTIGTMKNLAWHCGEPGGANLGRQYQLLHHLLGVQEDKHGKDSSELLPTLYDLAHCLENYREDAKREESLNIRQRILKIDEQSLGPDHLKVADDLLHIAQGGTTITQARESITRALSIREKRYGRDNLLVAECLVKLAELADVAGRQDEADHLFDEVLKIQEQFITVSDSYQLSIYKLENRAREKKEEAKLELYYQRCLEAYEQALGPDDCRTKNARWTMEMHKVKLADPWGWSEGYFRGQLAAAEKVYGPDHEQVADAAARLESYLDSKTHGESPEIAQLARQVFEIQSGQIARGETVDAESFAATLSSLGTQEEKRKEFGNAIDHYKESLALCLDKCLDMRAGMVLDDLVRCCVAAGLPRDALKYEMMRAHCRRKPWPEKSDDVTSRNASIERNVMASLTAEAWTPESSFAPDESTFTGSLVVTNAEEHDALDSDEMVDAVDASKRPNDPSQDSFVRAMQNRAVEGDPIAQNALGMLCFKGDLIEKDREEAARWFQAAAEQGDTDAQSNLGCLYAVGGGVSQDWKETVKWLTKSAENDNLIGQANLGYCYLYGKGVLKDPKAAVVWLRKGAHPPYSKAETWLGALHLGSRAIDGDARIALREIHHAAMQGDVTASRCLTELYLEGLGLPEDVDAAFAWLMTAADAEDTKAANVLAALNVPEYRDPIDVEGAIQWCQKSGANCDPAVQFRIGEAYRLGKGVARSGPETLKWHLLAANREHADSLYMVGEMYFWGKMVPQDYKEALKWLLLAAKQGKGAAQNILGWMYSQALGTTKDDVEAIRWFRAAAEAGYANSQNNLGWMIQNGRGCPKNEKEAADWYGKSANKGDPRGQLHYGMMLRFGNGVPMDQTKAAEWIKKAADKNDKEAQYEFATMLEKGEGVPASEKEALAYIRKAAQSGHESAKTRLLALEKP